MFNDHHAFLSDVIVCPFKMGDYIMFAMRHWNVRKFCALALVLLLGLGFAAHGVVAGEMAANMVTAGAGNSMPGSCDGCGDMPSMTANCSAVFCVGPAATAPPESVVALISSETLSFGGGGTPLALPIRPDPYPPKS